jgi:hypothetical protein
MSHRFLVEHVEVSARVRRARRARSETLVQLGPAGCAALGDGDGHWGDVEREHWRWSNSEPQRYGFDEDCER